MSSGAQIFAPSGLEVITNTEVWDSRTFKLLKTVPSFHRSSLSYSIAGDVLYCGSRSRVEILDGSTYDYISQLNLESSFASLSINADDTQIAVLENLSADRWPSESAWRIWDIGTSHTLDDEDNGDSDEEDDEVDQMADFDTGDDDDDDEDDDDGGEDDEGDDLDELDELEEEDLSDELLGVVDPMYIVGGPAVHGEEGDAEEDEEEDGEFENRGSDADTDFMDEDEELQFNSDGEVVMIDDYDPEGDGEYDDGDDSELNSEELEALVRQMAEADSNLSEEGLLAALMEESSGEGSDAAAEHRLRQWRRARSNQSGGRGGSSVFAELPSDEEAANELLEHGNVAQESSSLEEGDDEEVLVFGEDGQEVHSNNGTSTASPAAAHSEESSIEQPAGRATRRPANRRAGRRGMPSLGELGRLLGLVGKRTAAARDPHSSDDDSEPTESPPASKKPKRR